MLALLFEVTPTPDGYDAYLDIAGKLRPLLEMTEGFLSIDRYKSLSRPATLLSHSLWRDEASLAVWRTYEMHHNAQVAGRTNIFSDYRLRIAQVVREVVPGRPIWRPSRLTSYRDARGNPAQHVGIAFSECIVGSQALFSVSPTEEFESITRPGKFLSLYNFSGIPAYLDQLASTELEERGIAELRICELERDYGMFDRREAPQYYPPVSRNSL